jgi:Mn-dependent DtxR family transcriptional regulator
MDRTGYITVTDKGMDIAEKVYTRHKTLTRLFVSLGINPKTAEDDACSIEHDISDETFDALRKLTEQITDEE